MNDKMLMKCKSIKMKNTKKNTVGTVTKSGEQVRYVILIRLGTF